MRTTPAIKTSELNKNPEFMHLNCLIIFFLFNHILMVFDLLAKLPDDQVQIVVIVSLEKYSFVPAKLLATFVHITKYYLFDYIIIIVLRILF